MPELIDRLETLKNIETLCKAYMLHEPAGMGGMPAIRLCKEIVEKQPTIEPEVRRGRWVYKQWKSSVRTDEYTPAFVFECSECLSEVKATNCDLPLPKYCYECGADMRTPTNIKLDETDDAMRG